VILDPRSSQQHWPCLAKDTVAVVHARRAGWFNARDMGVHLLQRAREHGVRLIQARVEAVDMVSHQVRGSAIAERRRVDDDLRRSALSTAAGPYLKAVGKMLGADLAVYSDCHTKAAFVDHLGLVPARCAAAQCWTDPQPLGWNADERAEFASSDETRWLLGPFPSRSSTPGPKARPTAPSSSSCGTITPLD